MDRNRKKIISIGGGGFTHETDESLDQYILNQSDIKNLKIGFLPTASKDNEKKIDLFYKRFDYSYFQLSHFKLCSKIDGFRDWLLSKDIIYLFYEIAFKISTKSLPYFANQVCSSVNAIP